MAKSVFYSFHYAQDSWRVQQVINMGALEGQPLLKAQEWETVKRNGDAAVQQWIHQQMAYKKAVVVLIGSKTASRRWVKHEIVEAWNRKIPLVGVRIHGLADSFGKIGVRGPDPFASIALPSGKSVGDYVPVFDPAGWNSKEVHANIAANIANWVDRAYARS